MGESEKPPRTLVDLPRRDRVYVEHDRGCWEAFSPARGIAVLRIDGYLVKSDAEAFFPALDRIIGAQTEVDMFDDFEHFTGYEPAVREIYSVWTKERGPQLRASHVLVKSKIVAMGMAVANVARKRRMETYANRVRFEAALHAAIGRVKARG